MSRTLPLLLLALACGASDPNPAPTEVASRGVVIPPAPESPDPVYSPFLLRLDEGSPFGLISFKDVGMSLADDERVFVYESLAEGLAIALREHDAPLSSTVHHDHAIADPGNHTHCEGRHIYVDLWSEAEGWGYSLWSGCGEDDQFAHRAVRADRVDRLASLDPLAADIATSLREAVRTNCFNRHC
ncbi:MAG: hypothetical protein H6721_20555 [Sandaracinus sp.]|nr:hypothetical protein [Sandaracinus sp.]